MLFFGERVDGKSGDLLIGEAAVLHDQREPLVVVTLLDSLDGVAVVATERVPDHGDDGAEDDYANDHDQREHEFAPGDLSLLVRGHVVGDVVRRALVSVHPRG